MLHLLVERATGLLRDRVDYLLCRHGAEDHFVLADLLLDDELADGRQSDGHRLGLGLLLLLPALLRVDLLLDAAAGGGRK
jgi:hypothetical protein